MNGVPFTVGTKVQQTAALASLREDQLLLFSGECAVSLYLTLILEVIDVYSINPALLSIGCTCVPANALTVCACPVYIYHGLLAMHIDDNLKRVLDQLHWVRRSMRRFFRLFRRKPPLGNSLPGMTRGIPKAV